MGYNRDKLFPVKIIDVHQENAEHANIVVRHFPLTDNGKINWWLSHSEFIKKRITLLHKIVITLPYGISVMVIWRILIKKIFIVSLI